jgi:hypothetical protein
MMTYRQHAPDQRRYPTALLGVVLGNFFTAEPRHDWDNVLKRRIGVYTGKHKDQQRGHPERQKGYSIPANHVAEIAIEILQDTRTSCKYLVALKKGLDRKFITKLLQVCTSILKFRNLPRPLEQLPNIDNLFGISQF